MQKDFEFGLNLEKKRGQMKGFNIGAGHVQSGLDNLSQHTGSHHPEVHRHPHSYISVNTVRE